MSTVSSQNVSEKTTKANDSGDPKQDFCGKIYEFRIQQGKTWQDNKLKR